MENINNKELSICKKKTMGRRKIEIKKIEKKSSLQVTFSKRRTGLFRKASELSVLCGAEIAILVQSPANKIYSYGHPSVETLFHRYQTGGGGGAASSIIPYREDGRSKYDEAVKKLEIVKRSMKQESNSSSNTRFWWDEPMEGMELYELEEYAEAMEALKDNVLRRVDEMEKQKSIAASASMWDLDPTFQINYQDFDVSYNFLDFPLCF
ncbi:PREDICTED: agamous-like MADS-box protein AGL61 [Erythranthe guttata]|uniref:agamous-like MADS-box protein AGL61 n=1 Tax=Erythranthe guttata TaxID=4155 RepID=UPI00064DF221|nr:PREDICTED: agamous-like MADS-box protein AGL61 [Erythranthe guttata]|eukprot:XP_012833833.1 PREDICTED: agamous-like MADS-box protein AGL61 [Erythranthe guttata]